MHFCIFMSFIIMHFRAFSFTHFYCSFWKPQFQNMCTKPSWKRLTPLPIPPLPPPLIFPYFSLDFFIKFFASFFTFKCYGAAVLFLLYILAILLFLLYILAIVGKIVVFSRDIQSNSSDPTFKFDCSKLQTILFTTNVTSVHQFNNICCCVGYIIGHHHAESSCRN